MSIEQSKAVARRWIDEIWRKRNLDAIHELIAEDAVLHGSSPEPLVGPAAARDSVETMLEAFPDSQVDIVRLVAEDDLVAVHFRATGTPPRRLPRNPTDRQTGRNYRNQHHEG